MDYTTIDKAREIFTTHRVNEMVSVPLEVSKLLLKAIETHPYKAGQTLINVMKERPGSLAGLLDLIEGTAQSIADEEWFGNEPIKVAA